MRGAGKSTVGRILSEQLSWNFVDLDDLALGQLNCASVRNAFARHGEGAWRHAEERALESLFSNDAINAPMVVAVGAGAVTHTPSYQELSRAKSEGWRIIYLSAPVETLIARLRADMGDRSQLTKLEFDEEMRSLAQSRGGHYASLAHSEVDSAGGDPAWVAESIASQIAR